ncbi:MULTISPECIES: hypothetical protein [unclassified Streptomyces]|uniref:hypothetical protein n=1 Tax=unclassified Streptomyces TaxID=2593676 RepID=UPI0006FE11E7|nr:MULTISPECIES: hypothetical protein [unclassified Streptomyces]KQX50759.1 hypothetical protein ASD33_11940 [Streptomyces sp. Root1304]KRA84924.1 hypothetical protein ASE09_11945 [Streptomyces sp. Root66D1]
MSALRRREEDTPLPLLLVLASFALAGYAGLRLLQGDPWGVTLWFVGAALLHDLVLLPLYAMTDRAVQLLFPPREGADGTTSGARRARFGVNHVRVPAFLSGLVLLVYWPLVFRRVGHYTAATGLPADVFLGRWLLFTAALFIASAAVLLVPRIPRPRWPRRLRFRRPARRARA